MGLYAFLVFSIAAFAQLVVGYLIDNRSICSIFAWVAILQALLFTIMIQLTGIWVLIVAIAFMLVVFGEIPINDVLVGRMARSEWRSRAYSIAYIINFSVSASAVPLIAWIHGAWELAEALSALSPQWNRRSATVANRTFNKRLDDDLAYLIKTFEHRH